jgi:hypothetical protein
MQVAELDYIATSRAAQTSIAENYVACRFDRADSGGRTGSGALRHACAKSGETAGQDARLPLTTRSFLSM